MTYLQANNRSNKRQKRITFVSGIVALVIAGLFIWAPHFFPAVFNSIARPFWRMEFSLQSGSLRSPAQLLNENENLKQQLLDAQVRLQTIQATETKGVLPNNGDVYARASAFAVPGYGNFDIKKIQSLQFL